MNLPANINAARLPETYEAARVALSECSAVDECKDWADKAAALASYGKQAGDDQLERMAQRIRARAIRRAGELAKQLMQPAGRPSDNVEGDHNIMSRQQVKERAGFSDHQLTQSTRIASIPEQDFERQVEGDKPPTLSALAAQGIQRRDPPPDPQTWLKGRDPKAFNRALHFAGDITGYAATARKWDLSVLESLDAEQRAEIRNALRMIDSIHDKIATRI